MPLELGRQAACSSLGRQAEAGHRLAGDIEKLAYIIKGQGGNRQELIIGGEILEVGLEPTISSYRREA